MGFPADGVSSLYRNALPDVIRFFAAKHGNNARLYNLCIERGYSPADAFGTAVGVARFPMADGQVCVKCEDLKRN